MNSVYPSLNNWGQRAKFWSFSHWAHTLYSFTILTQSLCLTRIRVQTFAFVWPESILINSHAFLSTLNVLKFLMRIDDSRVPVWPQGEESRWSRLDEIKLSRDSTFTNSHPRVWLGLKRTKWFTWVSVDLHQTEVDISVGSDFTAGFTLAYGNFTKTCSFFCPI